MNPSKSVLLQFDPQLNVLGEGKRLAGGLSAVVKTGSNLWVANDETLCLERLTLKNTQEDDTIAADHCRFYLSNFFPLPVSDKGGQGLEADLEGLAYDDGYLWLIGSHSLKRKLPDNSKSVSKQHKHLATVVSEGNRYLLGRIPLTQRDGVYWPTKKVDSDGRHYRAEILCGDETGNELTRALQDDPHLGAFLAVPSKDNGFDIEGLAACGNRLFIGLRGPVLRGWAVILEVELDKKGKNLKAIGPKRRRYRKHFLKLAGLGIRDLSRKGKDLLILAGPTMSLDGPSAVFRWPNGACQARESVVSDDQLQHLMDLPYGRGNDHPEGMTLFTADGPCGDTILIVNDAAAPTRQPTANQLLADIFALQLE